MEKSEIFALINKNPVFHLATVSGDQPRLRALLLYAADENGIIFHTGNMKDLHKQVQANPNVEMCFNDMAAQVQVRVSGKLAMIDDLEFKKEIVENRAFLKPWVERDGYDMLIVYSLKNGQATTWTMEKNFEYPKPIIEL